MKGLSIHCSKLFLEIYEDSVGHLQAHIQSNKENRTLHFTIDSVIGLSKLFKIGEEIIAVSAIALGTSLPELIVTINAARKGKAELAVGNVLGSNIFNTFMVMGIPGLVGHLDIPRTIVTESVPTMIAGTLLLFFVAQDKKLTIWEGWLFYIMYIWFIGETFNFL